MSLNHDLILRQFKETVSITDDDLARSILESVDWNLETAINGYLDDSIVQASHPPPQSHLEAREILDPVANAFAAMNPPPSFQPEYREQDPEYRQIGDDDTSVGLSLGTAPIYDQMPRPQPPPAPASGQPSELKASSASTDSPHRNTPPAYSSILLPYPSRRYLHFSVRLDRRIEEIALPDYDTVADLKKEIETRFRISLQAKKLAGWRVSPSDDATLESMHLPKYSELTIMDSMASETTIPKHQVVTYNPEPTLSARSQSGMPDSQICTLVITYMSDGTTAKKELRYPLSTTVHQVKLDIYETSKIPVRQQKWTGWPAPPANSEWVRRQQRVGEPAQFDLNLPPAPFNEQNIKLKELQLKSPIHELQVEKLPEAVKKDRQKGSSKSNVPQIDGEADSRDRRGHRKHQPPPYDSAAAVGGDGEADSAAATGSASSGSKSPLSNASDDELDPPRFRPAFSAEAEDEPIETDVYQPGIGVDAFDYLVDEEDEEDARERSKRSANSEPLMPPNCYDEALAISSFGDNFKLRYGHCPSFYVGTLQDAIKAAFHQLRASDRKPLVIYLHHDQSIFSNIICGNVLGNAQLLKQLEEHCVVWPWDITEAGNKTRLLASINKQHPDLSVPTVPFAVPLEFPLEEVDHTPQSSVAGRILARLRTLPSPDDCPLLFVIIKKKVPVGLEGLPGAGPGSAAPPAIWIPSIVYEASGPSITSKELSSKLDDAYSAYRACLWNDIEIEMKREEDQRIRDMQRQEYLASERADREKDRRRQQAADEKKRREEQEAEAKLKRAEQEAQAQKKRDELRDLARRNLAPEPPPAERSGTVCTIKFMLPGGVGEVPPRRFALNAAVDQLFCFLAAHHNLLPNEIKLIQMFPKRELTHEGNHMKTIAELGFSATERINVQLIENDAALN